MIGIIERLLEGAAGAISILLKDVFTGETISTTRWTETESVDVTLSQKNGLIFQDATTNGSAGLSRLRSIQTFNPANYPVLVLRGELMQPNAVAPFGLRFAGPNPGGGFELIGFQGSYVTAGNADCVIYKNGVEAGSKAITQSFNTAFKVKITGNKAFFYVWKNGSWSEIHAAPYENKVDLYVDIYRDGKSINKTLSTADDIYVTDYDYGTYKPLSSKTPTKKPGLKAYYSFNKGYALDDYLNFHAWNYGATTEINGKSGFGFTFDGVDDYIELPFSLNQLFCDSSNSFTVGAWFKSTDLSGQHIILNYGGGTGAAANFTIYTENSDLMILLRGTYNNVGALTLDEWNLILIRWDGTTATAFFNGAKIAISVGTTSRQNYNNGIRFGQNCNPANQTLPAWFKGIIDEAPFYTTAITDEKAEEIWNDGNAITFEQL